MTVQFYGCIIDKAKGKTSYVPKSCSNLRQLVDELGEHLGQSFKDFLLGEETCLILINGKGVLLTGGLDTKLEQDSRVEIMPFIGAG